jgi:DNA (cytosine-5)-methyltransferase 1
VGAHAGADRTFTNTEQAKGHLLEALTEENSWLEFRVKWKGYALRNDADGIVREDALNCPAKLAEWVAAVRRAQAIPLPGQVDLVMGGPPCQGVSGLNRHGSTHNIIHDARYYGFVLIAMLFGGSACC